MNITLRERHRHFGGHTEFYHHQSACCDHEMRFAVFRPPIEQNAPILYFLSGLTCSEENFTLKAGAQRLAAELGLFLVIPDTCPRIDFNGSEQRDDLGTGAGYYLDATQGPWAKHYKMYSYVTDELPELIKSNFPVDASRESIFGHSMGGHGALMLYLRNQQRYRSVSAFAPVAAPTQRQTVPAAFSEYLGDDQANWQAYDSTLLLKKHGSKLPILIDQGTEDPVAPFLHTEQFVAACTEQKVALTMNWREGYDHAYFFISSFIDKHLHWHAKALSN